MFSEILSVWSDNLSLSAAIWLAILVFIAYLARSPAHALLRSTGRAVYVACRLFSASLPPRARCRSTALIRQHSTCSTLF